MTSNKYNLQQAAILIGALDAETADLLLGQMPPEQADAVRAALVEMGPVDVDKQQEVIDAFFRIEPLVPESDPPGLEIDDSLTPILARRREAAAEVSEDFFDPARPFSFLHDADCETIVGLLEREHPQVIALVLAHLPPDQAGDVLAQLPAAAQAEVLRRLAEITESDPDAVRDLERALKTCWDSRQSAHKRPAGMAAISAILNSSDATARRQILNNLAVHDRRLANKFAPLQAPARKFTFSELCECDLDTLTRVVRAADPETAILALAGAPEELVESLLDRLWPDEARRVSKGLAHLGPTRLADIEHGQEELARLAGQLHSQGHLPRLATHLTAFA